MNEYIEEIAIEETKREDSYKAAPTGTSGSACSLPLNATGECHVF